MCSASDIMWLKFVVLNIYCDLHIHVVYTMEYYITERQYFQISPMVTDHKGHCRSLFPIRKINLQTGALGISN